MKLSKTKTLGLNRLSDGGYDRGCCLGITEYGITAYSNHIIPKEERKGSVFSKHDGTTIIRIASAKIKVANIPVFRNERKLRPRRKFFPPENLQKVDENNDDIFNENMKY